MPTPDRIIRMASAFYESCVLLTAAELGVFGRLAAFGEADADTLAGALGLDGRGTRLLLDACTGLGLLVKTGSHYRNADEAAAFLVPGAPGDLSGALRYNRDVYPLWGRLSDMIRSGRPVEAPAVHLGADPERTRAFVMAMHYRALGIGRALTPCLDLAGKKSVLDVGGGPGTFAVQVARANPAVTCTVMDLPEVVAIADELIRQQGMAARVRTLAGNYRADSFPPGQDAVHFFGVLHQESPESILALFRKAYAALNPGGVVHIMDLMTEATHTQPVFSALFAVNMALTADAGWVFSDAELTGWLTQVGFTEVSVRPLPPPMPHWLATARKTSSQ